MQAEGLPPTAGRVEAEAQEHHDRRAKGNAEQGCIRGRVGVHGTTGQVQGHTLRSSALIWQQAPAAVVGHGSGACPGAVPAPGCAGGASIFAPRLIQKFRLSPAVRAFSCLLQEMSAVWMT